MSSIRTRIKNWGEDLATTYPGRGRNISPEHRSHAIEALVIDLIEKFEISREEFDLYLGDIVKECTPEDKDLRKTWGFGVVCHSTIELLEILNARFEPVQVDVSQVIKKICTKIGVRYKEKKTNKPKAKEFNIDFSKEVAVKKIEYKPSNQTPHDSEDMSLEELKTSLDQLLKSKVKFDKKLIEDTVITTIDEEVRKEFGLNDRGEFDI